MLAASMVSIGGLMLLGFTREFSSIFGGVRAPLNHLAGGQLIHYLDTKYDDRHCNICNILHRFLYQCG